MSQNNQRMNQSKYIKAIFSIPKTLLFLWTFLFFMIGANPTQAATDPTDSLKTVLSQTNTEEERIDVLYKLVLAYAGIDMQKAIPFSKEAISLAQKIESDTLLGTNLLALGALYINVGHPDSAMMTWQKALTMFERIDDQLGIADTYYKLAYIEMNRNSNYKLALEYCFKALKVYESLDYKIDQLKVHNDIAICYQKIDDIDKAYEWANALTEKATAFDNKKLYIQGIHVLGLLASEKGQYQKAIEYQDKCIAYYKKTQNLPSLSSVTSLKASALSSLNKKTDALKLYEEAVTLAIQSNFKPSLSLLYYKTGILHLENKDYNVAIQSFEKAKAKAIEYSVTEDLPKIDLGLSKAYEGIHNHKKALSFYQSHIMLKDSLFDKELIQKTAQIELGYEFDKEQLADSLAYAQQTTLLESSINQEKQARWFTFGIATLLAALLLGAFWTLRRNRKINQVLATQNELIEKRNTQNELLLKEIHHRVKNNLQTISSLLSLQSNDIDDANALEAVKASQSRVRSMALIHQKLYQGEQLASVKMKNYFETMVEALVDSFGEYAYNISIDIPMDEIELDVDTAIPVGLIVNELVTNSLKYAFPNNQNGNLSISLTPKDDQTLSLKVTDNGVGVDNTQSSGLRGTGFGTKLVNLLTMQLNGKMEQIAQKGTTVLINFSQNLNAA